MNDPSDLPPQSGPAVNPIHTMTSSVESPLLPVVVLNEEDIEVGKKPTVTHPRQTNKSSSSSSSSTSNTNPHKPAVLSPMKMTTRSSSFVYHRPSYQKAVVDHTATSKQLFYHDFVVTVFAIGTKFSFLFSPVCLLAILMVIFISTTVGEGPLMWIPVYIFSGLLMIVWLPIFAFICLFALLLVASQWNCIARAYDNETISQDDVIFHDMVLFPYMICMVPFRD
eukprot:scaffold691_cov181-Ochromonas_danica.AAC.11